MQTTSTSNLFQSDAQHLKHSYRAAKAELHQATADPIQLASKPLRVVVKQSVGKEADAWVAESGFLVRKVGLESGKTKQIYRGHTGPVTSIAFYTLPTTPPRQLLISGSWDKSIRVWDTATTAHLSTTVGHADFVKTLLVIPELDILLSGSSDKDVKIWDLRPLLTLPFTPSSSTSNSDEPPPVQVGAAPPAATPLSPLLPLLTLKSHTRPIELLSSYAIVNENEDPTGHYGVFSVDSMGAMKCWEVWKEGDEMKGVLRGERRDHELGIYDVTVRVNGLEGEMWTASADASVLLSTFSPSTPSISPQPHLRIPHPSPTKSLLSLSFSLPQLNQNILITGSSDESLRLFDIDSLLSTSTINSKTPEWRGISIPEKDLKGVLNALEGHSHEIVQITSYLVAGEGGTEAWVMTASLDGTLRRWKWKEMKEKQIIKGKLVMEDEKKEESLMTEEEERELEELMADD